MVLKVSRLDKITASFVRDYFTDLKIRQVVVFECWDPDGSFIYVSLFIF